MEWYIKCFKQYADFMGRARRKEYWMFTICNLIIGYGLGTLLGFLGLGWLGIIYSGAVFIPSIAVGVRRLHDTGRSGWWYLLCLIPIANLVLIYFFICDSQPGANQYGENPKGM